VLKQPGELAAAQHAGLIDHQDRAGVQLLASSVEVGQQPIAGGHVLEPLPLQTHCGDPRRGRGQQPVVVQLPGMAGDPKREGLAGPRPPDHYGDPLAALAQVPDHGLLVLAGGRMRHQRIAHRRMGGDRGLFARPVGGAGDQLLLDTKQVGGGPAAFLQGSVGDHADRPLGQEPVGQPLQFRPSDADETSTEGDQELGAGEGGRPLGQPFRAGQPIKQPTGHLIGHTPVLVATGCPAGPRPDQGVRVHAPLGRLGPPASIQGVRCLVLLRLPRRVDGPLDQPRRPLPTVRPTPVQLGVDPIGALGEATDQRLRHPLDLAVPWVSAAVHSTPSVRTSSRW
jgi:hypothetical protein